MRRKTLIVAVALLAGSSLPALSASGAYVGVDDPVEYFHLSALQGYGGATGEGYTAGATLWTWTFSLHIPQLTFESCAACQSAATPAQQAAAILDAVNSDPCNPGAPEAPPELRHLVGTMIQNRLRLGAPNVTTQYCDTQYVSILDFPLLDSFLEGLGQGSVADIGIMQAPFGCESEQAGFLGPWRHNAHLGPGTIHTTVVQAELAFLAQEFLAEGKCTPKNFQDETLTTNSYACVGTKCTRGYLTGTVLELPYCGDLTAAPSTIGVDATVVDASAQIGWDILVTGTLTYPNPLTENTCTGLTPLYGILEVTGRAYGIGA